MTGPKGGKLEDVADNFVSLFMIFIPRREIINLRTRWAGHVARTGEKKNSFGILVRKHGGKRPL
jgi:hypothetical protein